MYELNYTYIYISIYIESIIEQIIVKDRAKGKEEWNVNRLQGYL